MELFEFVKILFEKPEEYKKLKQHEKAKFFFMVSRFCSINFPIQANMFNHIKISQAETLDYWHDNLTRLFKKVPHWIYVKTKGNSKKEKISWPSEEATKIYLERTGKSRRDLQDAVKMFGAEAFEPIKRLEKLMEK